MPKRRSLEYHISLDVAVRNAKRLVANVRQNYARTPTCFDADGNALPPEEAIEDALDALVESIYNALPESVEVRRDGSYEADGEPWTREHKRKLRRKRPLTPHHLDCLLLDRGLRVDAGPFLGGPRSVRARGWAGAGYRRFFDRTQRKR